MAKSTDRKRKGTPIIAVLASIFIIFGGLVCGHFHYMANRTLPQNMMVAGVSIGGMKKEEAIATLTNKVQTAYSTKSLDITIDNYTVSIPASLVNISFPVEETVELAFYLPSDTREFDILPYLTFDQDSVKSALKEFDAHFDSDFTESYYEVKGDRPSLTEDTVTAEDQILVLHAGTPDFSVDSDKLYQAVLSCYNRGDFSLEFPLTKRFPTPLDIDSIYEELCVEPVNAEMDMKTFEVSQHAYGYAFDKAVAQSVLPNIAYGSTAEIPFRRIAPTVKHDELASLLYRDVLASYTAYSSSEPNRDTNLYLSCKAIDDVILYPGEVFSYNKTLGERTPEKGYKPAAGYWGKEVIESYGGGICQASSSLYYCALIADLEIVERHNHGYVSAYMPLGMDATVDWAGPDLKISNNTKYPIRIEAYSYGGAVTVKLHGTDTKDYYVKMSYEILEEDPPETVYVEMDEDNEKGYKDGEVITTPYTGYKVKTFKSRYNKQTDQLISRELEETSSYWRRDEEICKIIPPETTPPEETTEPSVETTAPVETTSPTDPGNAPETGSQESATETP